MKKGLLSILAGALLVVGCQNYDDQFSSLESQINALASTVAGLSQVQSDLSALSGTVSSLSSTVASLGSSIDTAVSNGLADITADIAALQAAVADVASTSDVTALQAAIAAAQSDLDELLANSTVFNDNIVVNSVATLDAHLAMGSGINIVNGNVTITVSAGMDATKVQTLVDNILTITKDLTYTGASTEAMPTFKNLSGVQSMTIEGAGDYRFDNLVSAGNIVLNNNSTKTTIVHFGKLTTYASIKDDGASAHTLSFPNAKEFHLTSLTVVPNSKLDITIDEGGVLAISSLTGLTATGEDDVLDLDIKGPASVALTTIRDGNIKLTDVKTASISDFYGTIDISTGVENLTVVKGVTINDLSAATDLEMVDLNLVTDYDPDISTSAAATAILPAAYRDLTFASPDLKTVKLSGKAKTVTIDTQNDLTSLTIDGHVTTLVVQNNESLSSLDVTGATTTIGNVTLNNNDAMTEAVLNHTSYTTTTDLGVTISVDGNKDLTTLRIHADKVDNLSIQSNPALTTVDFGTATKGLNAVGNTVAKSVTVAIDNNKLTASSAKDSWQASTAGTADAGSYTTSSGLDGLQTYLDAAIPLASAAGVKVFFDVITEYTLQSSENGTFTAQTVPTVAYNASNIYAVAYYEASNAVDTGRNTKQSATTVIPVSFDVNDADNLLNTTTGTDVITIVNGIGGSKSFEATSTNSIRTVDDLVAAIDGDTDVAGITVTADRDAFNEQIVTISWVTSDGAAGLTSNNTGVVYYTYGTDPETGTAIQGQTAAIASGAGSGAIAEAIATALNGDTGAYVATGTTDGRILITAQISNTIEEDRSPLSHAFQTLSIPALSESNTIGWAGNNAVHVLLAESASNTTASASKLFTVSTSAKTRSGIRVTLQNTAGVANLSSMGATAGDTSSALRYETGLTLFDIQLASSDLAAASINSSALDYVATFDQIEAVVPGTSTSGTTDRTGWLK